MFHVVHSTIMWLPSVFSDFPSYFLSFRWCFLSFLLFPDRSLEPCLSLRHSCTFIRVSCHFFRVLFPFLSLSLSCTKFFSVLFLPFVFLVLSFMFHVFPVLSFVFHVLPLVLPVFPFELHAFLSFLFLA